MSDEDEIDLNLFISFPPIEAFHNKEIEKEKEKECEPSTDKYQEFEDSNDPFSSTPFENSKNLVSSTSCETVIENEQFLKDECKQCSCVSWNSTGRLLAVRFYFFIVKKLILIF